MTVPSNFAAPVSGEWVSGGFDVPVRAAQAERPKSVEPTLPKPMSLVLPFIERERDQVLRLLAFIAKLSGRPLSRTLYLVPFKGMKMEGVLKLAAAAFADVDVIADSEGAVSDWKQGEKIRDAAGPNSLFRQAAWFFYLHPALGPWLWLEPDCVPLVPNWIEALEAAYRASGKPFMGARMKFFDGNEYLNGAAVYPRDAVGRAPALVTRATWTQFPEMEIAFDVAGGAEVLRQAAFTDLIQLGLSRVPGLDWQLVEPRDGAVLLHGDRDGHLLAKNLTFKPKGGENNGKPKSKPAAQTRAGQSKPESEPNTGSVNGNGAAHVQTVEPLPTVGDQMRAAVATLEGLASNANRRTRILKLLRKTTLLPRIAR